MKEIIIFLFMLFFVFHNAKGQEEIFTNIEHGVLFSPRLDSDDNLAFDVNGFGIEGGYYFLKKVGKYGSISIDVRLAYARSDRFYKNAGSFDDFALFTAFPDSIRTQRTGTVNYRNLSLSIPIKYRYHITEKSPIFLLVGFNPYFNLLDRTKWKFDEVEYDFNKDIVVSEIKNQEENLNQRSFSRDLLLAGFGYTKSNIMFDIYFSGGTTSFDHNYIRGMDKLSLVFNFYYRIN